MIRSLILAATVLAATSACDKPTTVSDPSGVRVVELTVTEKGFQPTPVAVKAGEPLKLLITRKTEKTCATDIVIEDYGIRTALPMNEAVAVAFTPTKAGELKYGCAMDGMIGGVLTVE